MADPAPPAADDPFVPPEIFNAAPLRANPHITTIVTPHGGHCAFVEPANGYDGYYAERLVIDFLASVQRNSRISAIIPLISQSW